MADDIEMDAPQISTLREEDTPEPQPAQSRSRTPKFRVKLLVGEGKRAGSATVTAQKVPYIARSDDEEEDDEEDQLIDDDEEEEPKAVLPAAVVSAPPMVEKKTAVPKRGGSMAGRGRGRGRGSRGGKPGRADAAPALAASASIDSIATAGTAGGSVSVPLGGTPKKRGGAKAGSTRGGPKKRGSTKQAAAVPLHMRDDAGSISEAYAGTAASSPAPHDDQSPVTHDVLLPGPTVPVSALPNLEDVNLEGVPLPSYPLPSRPFPVHPPPKIGGGFAPTIPLDKTAKRVRHWRPANREIRGIAGGRWFAKSWVGDKESAYATAAAATAAAMQAIAPGNIQDSASGLGPLPIPRLPGVTISGVGRGRPKMPKGDVFTNPSSRAQSIESISTMVPKKRTNSQMSGVETTAVSAPVG
ncbi:hypothetical protein BC835DRAFT_1363143 [Cytidiella melzeri]|nr:hypothetical protein BC835DRAFT_1363143 [Cytidiella melzeri]